MNNAYVELYMSIKYAALYVILSEYKMKYWKKMYRLYIGVKDV